MCHMLRREGDGVIGMPIDFEHPGHNAGGRGCLRGERNAASRGLVVNEDNSHFMLYRPAEKMTLDGLHEFIDQYAGTQVSELFLCPNGMRVNYRTNAEGWESIWDGNDGENHPHQWVRHCWLLNDRGLDPYAVWVARCREKGISPWISMRMNIYTWSDEPGHFSHSTWWKEHPECWRLRPEKSNLDYGVKEVRERAMRLVREYLDRYDMDGLELDWMRLPEHFAPGKEQEGRAILTAFMGEIRALTEQWSAKRGHPIQIAARVPALPEAALGLGVDAPVWAKAGFVDILVLAPFLDADFDIPVERWRKLLGPPAEKITLAACLESDARGHPELGSAAKRWVSNDVAAVRGFTAAMLDRGADQIYLFNLMDPGYGSSSTMSADEYRAITNEAARLDTVLDKPRRHIVTSPDTVPPGAAVAFALPVNLGTETPAAFDLYTGPKPSSGRVAIRAVLADRPHTAQAQLAARLNGIDCPAMPDLDKLATFSHRMRITRFDVPLAAMNRECNRIEISLSRGSEQTLLWVELFIAP